MKKVRTVRYTYNYPVVDCISTGNYIKDKCMEKEIDVKMIAEAVNVSPRAVHRWFKGTALCDIDHLIALSCMLDEPLDVLVKRK